MKCFLKILRSEPGTMLWLAAIALWSPLASYGYDLLLLVIFGTYVVPMLIVIQLVLLFPFVVVFKFFMALSAGMRRKAAAYLCVLPLGFIAFYGSRFTADVIAIQTIGPYMLREIEATRAGKKPLEQRLLSISSEEPTIAFYVNGGFVGSTQGVVYDASDKIAYELPKEPENRDVLWQRNAVNYLSCKGKVRPVYGHFYFVNIDLHDC